MWGKDCWDVGWRVTVVPRSVLEAIKLGMWDFEPETRDGDQYEPTEALPGSPEKLAVLSERVRLGLPLWHPHDRRSYGDGVEE